MAIEIVARRDGLNGVLIVMQLPEHVIQEDGSLEPPVTVELRVIRADHDGRTIHAGAEPINLLLQLTAEM